MNLSTKKCLVYDLGIFTENAARIARDVEKCWYFSPWVEAFPEAFKAEIGQGFDGLERIKNFWDFVDKADFVFIPDTYCGDLTEYLKSKGIPTAGAGAAEKIELDRWHGRTVQKVNGLPVQETHRIVGVSALRDFAKDHKNFHVKLDTFRGVKETFKHADSKSSENQIDYIAYKMGPLKEEIVFIVEEDIEGVEPGLDGITFDGDLLFPTMVGYEVKGAGYIGRVYNASQEAPAPLLILHNGLSSEFRKLSTRFFYSVEAKVGRDRIPFLLDPTIRLAAPGVAAIQTELIENYSEVVYGLACGEKIHPKMRSKYCAAMPMESSESAKSFLNVLFPRELRPWVKFRVAMKHKGDYYSIPPFDSICTVIALGNSIPEVVETVKERAKKIEGICLGSNVGEFEEIQEKIQEGKKNGISF